MISRWCPLHYSAASHFGAVCQAVELHAHWYMRLDVNSPIIYTSSDSFTLCCSTGETLCRLAGVDHARRCTTAPLLKALDPHVCDPSRLKAL